MHDELSRFRFIFAYKKKRKKSTFFNNLFSSSLLVVLLGLHNWEHSKLGYQRLAYITIHIFNSWVQNQKTSNFFYGQLYIYNDYFLHMQLALEAINSKLNEHRQLSNASKKKVLFFVAFKIPICFIIKITHHRCLHCYSQNKINSITLLYTFLFIPIRKKYNWKDESTLRWNTHKKTLLHFS